MFSEAATSSIVAKSPVSNSFRQRKPRASALSRALSTRALGAGAAATPSGVMTSFRPPRLRIANDTVKLICTGHEAADVMRSGANACRELRVPLQSILGDRLGIRGLTILSLESPRSQPWLRAPKNINIIL